MLDVNPCRAIEPEDISPNSPTSQPTNIGTDQRAYAARIIRQLVGLFLPTFGCPARWLYIGFYGKKISVVSLLPEMAVVLSEWRRLAVLVLEKSSRKLRLCIQTTGRIARLYAAVEIGSPAIRPKADFMFVGT